MSNVERISEDVLAEQWYSFIHDLIGNMQAAFRAAGITQKVISRRLGKKESFISRCLSGQQNMTVRTIFYISRAMGYRLEIRFRRLSSLKTANNQPKQHIQAAATSAITPSGANIARKDSNAATVGNRLFANVE